MSKVGRPRIEIDKNEFEKLCGLHATRNEIAGWFECSEDTIENWCNSTYGVNFSVIFKQKASRGKISLRRKQMEVALNGSIPMLIFLGKNKLGQRDSFEKESDGDVEIKLKYNLGDDEEK